MTRARTLLEQTVAKAIRGDDLAHQDLAKEVPPISVLAPSWLLGGERLVVAGDDAKLAWTRVFEHQLLGDDMLSALSPAQRTEVRLLHGRAVLGWMSEDELSPKIDRKPATYPVMKFKRRWNVDVRKGPPVTASVDGLTFQLDGSIARRVGGSPLTEELLSQARTVCEQVLLAVTKEPRPR